MKLKTRKPTCINILTDLRLQSRTEPLEKSIMLHFRCFPCRLGANCIESLSRTVAVTKCPCRYGIDLHYLPPSEWSPAN